MWLETIITSVLEIRKLGRREAGESAQGSEAQEVWLQTICSTVGSLFIDLLTG